MAAQSTEFSFPWDSSSGDREYTAEDFRRYYQAFVTTGVFMSDSTSLQVTAYSGMQIYVAEGSAIIIGARYENEGSTYLTLSAADGSYDRIDRIVLRWDLENREMYVDVLEGTAASSPTAPDVTRTDDVYELALADITVAAGVTEITQSAITDMRMDSTVCGEALPWAELDTSELAAQYQTWAEEQKTAFQEWVDTIKDILDDETAGHLQLEIEEEILKRQGYESTTTVFNSDGSITGTDEDGNVTTTVFNSDGSITSTKETSGGGSIAEATTVFNSDGSITTTATRY